MEEGDEDIVECKSLTPTQPVLLSQHAEILKTNQVFEEPKLPSQSIDEILGTEQPTKVSPVRMANIEAISNSSSPIENEKLQQMKEQKANADKIEIQVDLTEE